MSLRAVAFDLDGVITDTAEYHYRAWKRLADEEGLPFDRQVNEQLRGVSRRESLLIILGDERVSEDTLQEMMARKNGYYQAFLEQVSPADLLPGVAPLLDQLDAAGIPYGIASASKNARTVVERLGIGHRVAAIADGHSVARPKPAPDLFRFAAVQLGVTPDTCLVVEDAAAGIAAALAAGMPALALGPAGRFPSPHVPRHDSLANVTLADLRAVVTADSTWHVTEHGFDSAAQHHKETIFAVGNGYFTTRGTFEETHPGDMPITFAHGVWDDMPVSVTELVNLPRWIDLAITVDGDAFRLDRGTVHHFRRRLDLRDGVLRRTVRWEAPSGAVVDLTFERFAGYDAPHLGALRALVTAVNREVAVKVHAGIDGHVANENLLHWTHLDQGQVENGAVWLHSRTRGTGLELGTAAIVTTSGEEPAGSPLCPGQPRLSTAATLAPGQTLQVDKLAAYATERDPGAGDRPVVERALTHLQGHTYDALLAAQQHAWTNLWQAADVTIEGDDEAQLALRFSIFHLLIAAPRKDERVSIGAKTLTGYGYRGHVFWDTEIFILPFFSYVFPDIARNLLAYRYHTLPGARRKAAANGYEGAQFAWESAESGDEVTPTWVPGPDGELIRIWTGDIEIHISADVAYAIDQYWQVTGDDTFVRDMGAEIILDTARFWGSRAEREETESGYQYAFRDVIGPDEYHDHVDNNAFTNRMAQWHLEKALEILDWLHALFPEKAATLVKELDLSAARLAHWRDVIGHVVIPHDPNSGLMVQFEGFFELPELDWDAFEERTRSLQAILGIEAANNSQVLKQADVIMLLCLLRDEYDRKTWRTNWETYMPLTDHTYGSSLGPSFHAWAAAEMDRPEEAYEHFMLAARADLRDVRGNAGEGIHAASAGGVWQAAVFGFGGLRLEAGRLRVRPRLPAHWQRLKFTITHRGRSYAIDIDKTGGDVTVQMDEK